MRTDRHHTLAVMALTAVFALTGPAGAGLLLAAEKESETASPETGPTAQAVNPPVTSKGVAAGQATQALDVQLPRAKFTETPQDIRPSPMLEPYAPAPRPPFLVPKGCRNVALGKPVTSSDRVPIIGELEMVTDGDKEADDGSYVELAPGRQWVQIDLKARCALYAVLVWHQHGVPCVYHDVVVQVSDNPDFVEGVTTVYNNDFDNSAGLGIGKDLEYVEDYRGRLIDAAGAKGRYVRLYSAGSTANDQNQVIEVEVHGKPAS